MWCSVLVHGMGDSKPCVCTAVCVTSTICCRDNASANAMELAPIAEPQLILCKNHLNGHVYQILCLPLYYNV